MLLKALISDPSSVSPLSMRPKGSHTGSQREATPVSFVLFISDSICLSVSFECPCGDVYIGVTLRVVEMYILSKKFYLQTSHRSASKSTGIDFTMLVTTRKLLSRPNLASKWGIAFTSKFTRCK